MPRAASTARRTSSRWMSRGRLPTVIPPRLFPPRTCVPATPISADSTGTPTMVSASSTARRIELTARSRFTICPLRQPFDSAAPRAANVTLPSSPSSPINAQVFVLPMSSPTICRSFFVKSAPYNFVRSILLLCPFLRMPLSGMKRLPRLFHHCNWPRNRRGPCRRHRAWRDSRDWWDSRRFWVHNRLSVETQVHRFHAPCFCAPLSEVIQQCSIFGLEIVVTEVHQHRRIHIVLVSCRVF